MKCLKIFRRMKNVLTSKLPPNIPHRLFIMAFINAALFGVQLSNVYSFLPKWVKSFGVKEVNVGRQAGIIASSFYIGNCLSSVVWGYVSDRWGRKTGIVLR